MDMDTYGHGHMLRLTNGVIIGPSIHQSRKIRASRMIRVSTNGTLKVARVCDRLVELELVGLTT